MKQKDYQKPMMQVVKLQQQSVICSSPDQVGATMPGQFTEEDI